MSPLWKLTVASVTAVGGWIALTGCLSVGANGLPVSITSETALIFWDGTTHTEHFIRAANFATQASDLGFLVPTPSPPKLKSEDRIALETADNIEKMHLPVSITERVGDLLKGPVSSAAAKAISVEVIGSYRVSGYDATILTAQNASALTEWLHKNKYPVDDRTTQWLAPYIRDRWTITAFKVPSGKSVASLSLVDLAFTTERPFYPYREPSGSSSAGSPRSLKVLFISDGPVSAKLEDSPWVGQQVVSDRLFDYDIRNLQSSLTGIDVPSNAWLTSFLDSSSPRRGTADVYFEAARPSFFPWFLAGCLGLGAIGAIRYRTIRKTLERPH